MDLHWCDLESFFGLPAELGTSPWDSDEEASSRTQTSGSVFSYPSTWPRFSPPCTQLNAGNSSTCFSRDLANRAAPPYQDEEEPWRCICVYLDASLNRLRGIDVISDQPSLRELASAALTSSRIDCIGAMCDLFRAGGGCSYPAPRPGREQFLLAGECPRDVFGVKGGIYLGYLVRDKQLQQFYARTR